MAMNPDLEVAEMITTTREGHQKEMAPKTDNLRLRKFELITFTMI